MSRRSVVQRWPQVPTAEKAAEAESIGSRHVQHEAADHPLLLTGRRPEHKDLIDMTAMVDMFTIIVLFLIANFSATGDILNMTKDIVLPEAQNGNRI